MDPEDASLQLTTGANKIRTRTYRIIYLVCPDRGKRTAGRGQALEAF